MIRLKWVSPLELRVFAEHGDDVEDLRRIMDPGSRYGLLIYEGTVSELRDVEVPKSLITGMEK